MIEPVIINGFEYYYKHLLDKKSIWVVTLNSCPLNFKSCLNIRSVETPVLGQRDLFQKISSVDFNQKKYILVLKPLPYKSKKTT